MAIVAIDRHGAPHSQAGSASEGYCRDADRACSLLVPRADAARRRSRAFTLLELLIAMALTLLLVVALSQFYVYVGDTVRDGRAIVEMGGDLRNAYRQLRDDLNAVTVKPVPPIKSGDPEGYLEIVEGVASDFDVNGDGTVTQGLLTDPTAEAIDLNGDGVFESGKMLGDTDDILSMTIRSSGVPFVGRRYNSMTGVYDQIESDLAEVVWFTSFKDLNGNDSWSPDEPRFLVRRQLLIRPDLTTLSTPNLGQGENFFHHNDISCHYDTVNNRWVANSLSDLCRRENRFVHLNLQQLSRNGLRAAEANPPIPNPNTAAYMPNPLWMLVNVGGRPNGQISGNQMAVDQYTLQRTQDPNTGAIADFTGEDQILSNVLAFDVRVYDPTARLYGDNANANNALAALQPGDPGYASAYQLNPNNPVGFGAYVDLYYKRDPSLSGLPANFSYFSDAPRIRSNSYFPDGTNTYLIASYDTWTTYYEHDGLDQYGDMRIDWGTDGIDNDGMNGVDNGGDPNVPNDIGEFETAPPYLAPLRGIQVRIRVYEPGTRQTMQSTVIADFVSE